MTYNIKDIKTGKYVNQWDVGDNTSITLGRDPVEFTVDEVDNFFMTFGANDYSVIEVTT